MGPAMNLLLAVVLAGRRAVSGRRSAGLSTINRRSSAWSRPDLRRRGGHPPGDLIVSVADRDVTTWEDFFIAIGTRPNREITIELLRDGLEVDPQGHAGALDGESRFEIGDIGVLPNVHPQLRAVNPGEPATGRSQGRRRHLAVERRADHASRLSSRA